MLLQCAFYFPPLFSSIAFTLHSILQYWCFICLLFFSSDYVFTSCPQFYHINNDFDFIVSRGICGEPGLAYTAGSYEWKQKVLCATQCVSE